MSFSQASGSRSAPRGLARGETLSLKELARLRQSAYRLLGAVLLYPDEEWFAALPRVAKELLEGSRPFMEFAFWGRWERMLDSLEKLSDTDRTALEAVYVSGFTAPSGEGQCLPYESAYLPPENRAWVMAELDREYGRNGFSVAPSLNEPPDHAAVELEFVSLLCSQEAEAWTWKNVRDAVEHLDNERGFLSRHLCQWIPEFARRVASRDDDGFYALAADAAQAFIAHDLDLITALLGHFREVAEG